jgi:hypothetical protein
MPLTSSEFPDRVVEFDMYAAPPPSSDWDYALDDHGVVYRRGLVAQKLRRGWWPFAYQDPDREHRWRREIGPPIPVECGAASVRLAPDCHRSAWRNEYVTVRPDRTVPHHAAATLTLWVRPRGLAGLVARCAVHFDLQAGTYRIARLHQALPSEVHAQATLKAEKLTAYLTAEVTNRDGDRTRPATVAERVRERQHRPGPWEEPDPRNGRPGWSRHVGDGVRYLFVCQVTGGWAWTVCQYGQVGEFLAQGEASDAATAMALADAAASQHRAPGTEDQQHGRSSR